MRGWAKQSIKAQTCVTSPPYFGLRDYGVAGQLGLEQSPEEYVAAMVEVFRCVRDVLAADGTLWLNIGDSYASTGTTRWPCTTKGYGKHGTWHGGEKVRPSGGGLPPKQLLGIPWRLAFALQADGWFLRQDIIWHKPNPMPESVRDRCTKAHEYLFLLSKSERYYFDSAAMQEPAETTPRGRSHSFARKTATTPPPNTPAQHRSGRKDVEHAGTRNRRSVWTVATRPYKGAHFATFPPALIEPCIQAGSRLGDIVLDPFMGSGTTAAVARHLGRQYLGCELNPEYGPLQQQRLQIARDEPAHA